MQQTMMSHRSMALAALDSQVLLKWVFSGNIFGQFALVYFNKFGIKMTIKIVKILHKEIYKSHKNTYRSILPVKFFTNFVLRAGPAKIRGGVRHVDIG